MRDRFFRVAALILGALGVPSLIWQAYQDWPLDPHRLGFLVSQCLNICLFLVYGLRVWPMTPGYQGSKPEASRRGDWSEEI